MKFHHFSILSLFLIFASCSNSTDNDGDSFIVTLGENNESEIKTKKILNPEITSEWGNSTFYGFDFNGDDEYDLSITQEKGLAGLNFTNTVSINVHSALVTFNQDQMTRSRTAYSDSTAFLSKNSAFINYPNITSQSTVLNILPENFLTGTDINLIDPDLVWSSRHDASTFGYFGLYLYLHRTRNWDTNINNIQDYYYEGARNKGHQFVLFKWPDYNNSNPVQYFYGWMEYSLSKDLELTIHSVEYQTEGKIE